MSEMLMQKKGGLHVSFFYFLKMLRSFNVKRRGKKCCDKKKRDQKDNADLVVNTHDNNL
jgi:hypothetical protein